MCARPRFGVVVLVVAALALLLGPLTAGARAGIIDTVNWAPDATTDGTGTGILASGTIVVTYTTIPAVGNAGIMLPENWDTSLATTPFAAGGVTFNTGGVLGTTRTLSPFTQTISFSKPVLNPVLLVNFTDDPTSFNFGTLPVSFVSNHNSILTGDVVTFSGTSNSSNDGFALLINGTFGPGNPLVFTYSSTMAGITPADFDSVGFTVSAAAAPAVTPVPEPSTLALLSLGGVALAGWRRWKGRRQRRNTAA